MIFTQKHLKRTVLLQRRDRATWQLCTWSKCRKKWFTVSSITDSMPRRRSAQFVLLFGVLTLLAYFKMEWNGIYLKGSYILVFFNFKCEHVSLYIFLIASVSIALKMYASSALRQPIKNIQVNNVYYEAPFYYKTSYSVISHILFLISQIWFCDTKNNLWYLKIFCDIDFVI